MESSRLFAEDEATREWQRSASDDDAPSGARFVKAGKRLGGGTDKARKPPPPPPRRVGPPGPAPKRSAPPPAPPASARPPQESAIFVVPALPGAGRRTLPPPPNHVATSGRRPLPTPPPKSSRPVPAPPASRASAPGPVAGEPLPAFSMSPTGEYATVARSNAGLPAFALPRTGEYAAVAATGDSGLPTFALPASPYVNGAARPSAPPSLRPPFAPPQPAAGRAPRTMLPAFTLRDEEPANDAQDRLFGPDENTRQKPLAAPAPSPSRASFQAPLSSAPMSRPSEPEAALPEELVPTAPRIVPHPAFAAAAARAEIARMDAIARGEVAPAAMLRVPPTPPAPRMPAPSTLAATDLSVPRAADAQQDRQSEVTVNPPPAPAPSADAVARLVALAKLHLARRVHPSGPTLGAVVAAAMPVLALLVVLLSGPSTGTLRINADARVDGRADVFMDGRKVCESVPCVVNEVEPGERTVRVMADGYDAAPAVSVTVESGAEAEALVPLGQRERATTTTVQPGAIPANTLGVILPGSQRR